MNAYWMKRWVEALRSNEYEQGKGALRNDGTDGKSRWCCLGVLGNLMSEYVQWHQRDTYDITLDGLPAYLSPRLAKIVGLQDWEQRFLAGLNDGGVSFETIATLIERLQENPTPRVPYWVQEELWRHGSHTSDILRPLPTMGQHQPDYALTVKQFIQDIAVHQPYQLEYVTTGGSSGFSG